MDTSFGLLLCLLGQVSTRHALQFCWDDLFRWFSQQLTSCRTWAWRAGSGEDKIRGSFSGLLDSSLGFLAEGIDCLWSLKVERGRCLQLLKSFSWFLSARWYLIPFRTQMIWPCPFNIVRGPIKECFPPQDGRASVLWKYKVINHLVPLCISSN